MKEPLYTIPCLPDGSLWDVALRMRSEGAKDEFRFFASLGAKFPLLESVNEGIKDRFLRCEVSAFELEQVTGADAEPLLFCALNDGIAVGFPSKPIWERDVITMKIIEIDLSETITESFERVDNLTGVKHAERIVDSEHSRILSSARNFSHLAEARERVFPNLRFGEDSWEYIGTLNVSLSAIIKKLKLLDEFAEEWASSRGPLPRWGQQVSDESERVKNNPRLRSHREFKSCDGEIRLFSLHMKFANGDRIHFRCTRDDFSIEIGYIGSHLPLE